MTNDASNGWEAVRPGEGIPKYDNAPEPPSRFTPSLYANVQALFDGGDLEAPAPSAGIREDNVRLFYPSMVNVLIGDPEAGKTLVASAVAADVCFEGGSILVIDVDHNGASATVKRLESFGMSRAVLENPERFRYASPEDAQELLAVVEEAKVWRPSFVLVDSVGEVLPMFGASSNDADQYTAVHRQVFTALANSGSVVVIIDHESKGTDSRKYGAGGTMAKKRAIDGALYRVKVIRPFSPGNGGKSALYILKDRHGQVRMNASLTGSEPLAATFLMSHGVTTWKFYAPTDSDDFFAQRKAQELETLAQRLLNLGELPTSVAKAKALLGVGQDKAQAALERARELNAQPKI